LAGSPALSGALAFFVAGYLGTALSWRYSFGILTLVSFLVFFLSFRMKNIPGEKGIQIDGVGALLSGVAIVLISFGFNNLNSWGLVAATEAAPFDLLGLSPAPFMIVLGLVLGWGFFAWSNRRVAQEQVPLLAVEMLASSREKATILALLVIGALGPAVNFLIPLYIQIVQGRTSLFTAVAVVPYTLTIAASAMLVVRLYDRFNPRQIAMSGFAIVAVGLALLAVTISNEWNTAVVILGLIMVGLGEGSLLTLLFNVMVTSAPKELAGDVGALRGVANNLSTGLGTAFAGVVAVGLLSLFVTSALMQSTIPDSLKAQVNLNNINFISNDQLETVLLETDATPDQVAEAIHINETNRLRALRASFLILATLSLVGLLPATGLPNYAPGEIPPTPATMKERRSIRKKLRSLTQRAST
ncbi:MAG: MFS transporter, partial [Anaerolineales bacterium]|nr:MFS transporter [Anaerolineales bacterium]